MGEQDIDDYRLTTPVSDIMNTNFAVVTSGDEAEVGELFAVMEPD